MIELQNNMPMLSHYSIHIHTQIDTHRYIYIYIKDLIGYIKT